MKSLRLMRSGSTPEPPPIASRPAGLRAVHRIRRACSVALACALLAGPWSVARANPGAGDPPPSSDADAADAATGSPAPVLDSEKEARERQDALEESRSSLESVEKHALETLKASDLPEPCTGPWDWVHLSSGEWLRGEFKRMRKKKFQFRSTRMESQTIDWKHIKEFCFTRDTQFILYDHTVMVGRGSLVDGQLTVVGRGGPETASRESIWTMLPGLPTEINLWRASLSAGLDAYAGNTDQQNLTAFVSADREDPITHLGLDYTTSFGVTGGVQNVKRHRATAEFDVYFNRALFAGLPFIEYSSDTFQNLEQRVISGLGLGYRFLDFDDIEWDAQAGLGHQYTQYVSLAPGQDQRENDVGLRFTTNLDWDITEDLSFEFSQGAVLLLIDFEQSNFHTQGSLVYDVTDLIYLEFSAWYDRVLDPRPTADGSVPNGNDSRTVVSIGLNFD